MRRKFLLEIFFAGTFFWRIVKKSAKFAKIRTRKNLVPNGIPKRHAHHHIIRRDAWGRGRVDPREKSLAIALFTVTFSHLHYNVFERGCEAISGNCVVSARNCLTSTFKSILMQMRKGNCEKGYSYRIDMCFGKMMFRV